MDFITEAEADGRPWCMHLSYIKPHWPYIVPEPYASMYGPADVQPVIRSDGERQNPHPVFGAYMDMRYSRFIPMYNSQRIELFFEAKNLFNTENVASVNRIVTTDAAGNPSAPLPDPFPPTTGYDQRQMQLGVKFVF